LVTKASAHAVSAFGATVKAKLSNPSITGAPEDQLRGPLETLIVELAEIEKWTVGKPQLIGETSLTHLQARPDFAVSLDNALVGFIEVKAPGKGLDPRKFTDPHDKAQWVKFKLLPNLLYTDGSGFSLWRNGEPEGKAVSLEGDIETSGSKLRAPDTLAALLSDFLNWTPQPPANAERLAEVSARLCRLLRDEVLEQIEQGQESLLHLRDDWRKLLFPNADNEQFADGYAQAVTFGLLMASALNISLKDGVETAALKLKQSNSLIGVALNLLTEDEANRDALRTSLGTLLRVLDEVNWSVITKDKPDAWLNFYEDFLQVYDNNLRKLTGSYYTPPEVVGPMTRLVDEALRGPLFQRALGLAAPDVTIADPAVGTGTFLLGVLDNIAATVAADQGAGAVPGAIAEAAKRIFGFEVQFGPFAVAQLRVLAELRTLTKAKFGTGPTLNLYITDTLGNPFVEEEQLPHIVEAVAKSRRDANKVKRGQPITVVIGNPPYKNRAAGRGGWIEAGSTGRASPMAQWAPSLAWGVGAHTHHLKNLYVFFWRWATLKVFGSGWREATGEPETDRPGVICFITASGFLSGPGFQQMREQLRRDASEIWVIDCSPEGYQPNVPTRIFEGVQQPICIVLIARATNKSRAIPARLRVTTLPLGPRKAKFDSLAKLTLNGTQWREGPKGWREPFLPTMASSWSNFPRLASLFSWSGLGVTPHRTWPIAPDADTLRRRWDRLKSEPDPERKEILFHADDDRQIEKVVTRALGHHCTRDITVAKDKGSVIAPVRYAWRSFDRQWTIPDHRLLSRARPQLWARDSQAQIYVTAIERSAPRNGPAITMTDLIPDHDHYKGSFGGRVYPLWADAKAESPNLRSEWLALLSQTYGATVSPDEAFAYVAAVMAHPAYTARFAGDLKRPGLRLPLTADAELFGEAAALGREVVWLFCYGGRFVDPSAGRPKGPPRMAKDVGPLVPKDGAIPPAPEPLPDALTYEAEKHRLHIGKGYVDNVTPEMWNYQVSRKRVVWQWFSYRRLNRSRAVIGDKRSPSPLEKIQPEGWLHEYTTDLLDLLHVLGRLVELEPRQADLLAKICEGPLISPDDLRKAGLFKTEESDAKVGDEEA
jgi:hypothetical protein